PVGKLDLGLIQGIRDDGRPFANAFDAVGQKSSRAGSEIGLQQHLSVLLDAPEVIGSFGSGEGGDDTHQVDVLGLEDKIIYVKANLGPTLAAPGDQITGSLGVAGAEQDQEADRYSGADELPGLVVRDGGTFETQIL